MLEFAFSAVILFILLFGSIGVTMALYTYEVVNQYARDASRYAIVHGDDCSIPPDFTPPAPSAQAERPHAPANVALKTYLNHQIFPGINGANLTVTTAYAIAPGAANARPTLPPPATAPAIRSPLPSLTPTSTTSLSSRGVSSP